MPSSGGSEAARKVAIVGLGLIGGSLALCLSRRCPGVQVVGVDRSEREIAAALGLGAVSEADSDLAVVAGADLLIIATPLEAMADVARAALPHLAERCNITDVGSTKGQIARDMAALLEPSGGGRCYVGGHPMAGSELQGMEAASELLFENAVYVLTPGTAPAQRVREVQASLACTGAFFVEMDAEAHDEAVAAVSHVPHVAAAALVNLLADAGVAEAARLAGGGFRDATRIAAGDPGLWRGILHSNSARVLPLLASLRSSIHDIEQAIAAGDDHALEALLLRAKSVRDAVPARGRSDLPPVYDVIVALADRPGSINALASLLGAEGLNIADIEILRVREGFGGTLRVGFTTEDDARGALDCLLRGGYQVRGRGDGV
jgi:prephenate dehydrogenase